MGGMKVFETGKGADAYRVPAEGRALDAAVDPFLHPIHLDREVPYSVELLHSTVWRGTAEGWDSFGHRTDSTLARSILSRDTAVPRVPNFFDHVSRLAGATLSMLCRFPEVLWQVPQAPLRSLMAK